MTSLVSYGSQSRHQALFYDDEAELYDVTAEFVQEGLDQDEVVLVDTGAGPLTERLRDRFEDHRDVVFGDEEALRKPVAAIEHYKREMDRGLAAGVPGYRALGRTPVGDGVLPWSEWARFEGALNQVFADYPFRSLCLYQVHEPPSADEVSSLLDLERVVDPLQAREPDLAIDAVADLDDVRLQMHATAMRSVLRRRVVDDFVTAVLEVLYNAREHGRPPVGVRMWIGQDRLVCMVSDHGEGIADPLQGYIRPTPGTSVPPTVDAAADPDTDHRAHHRGQGHRRDPYDDRGLGLWAARQLVDILDYGHEGGRFGVQLVALDRG